MKYYIDNYRGFINELIELDDVNFFVGENSTGKTSLISAITLISNYRFWITGEIASDLIDFSSFEDLHSANNTQKYFTLGIIDDEKEKSLHYLSFNDDKGIPIIYREIIYAIGTPVLIIEYSTRNLLFKLINEFQAPNINDAAKTIMSFITSKKIEKQKYQELDLTGFKKNRFPPHFYKQILQDKNEVIKKKFGKLRTFNGIFNLDISSLAPIRAKPLPLYSGASQSFSPEGVHTPFLIKEEIRKRTKLTMLNSYGKNSGLFDGIDTKMFGNKKVSPFELLIRKSQSKFKISSVGYGVSQILPIISEILFHQQNDIIMVQQPEIHLHPKAQAAFGEYLHNMLTQSKKRKFIVETHSDYVIDRFRLVQKHSKEKVKAKIVFFKNDGKNNNLYYIRINDDGKYPEDIIEEFREFFIDEALKLMEI